MDIIDFLRPKFVLMENVVDILRFAGGCLGRYAISRLVSMHYQSRVGIMAAGCYGLPQFRLRTFLWGAYPHEASTINSCVGENHFSFSKALSAAFEKKKAILEVVNCVCKHNLYWTCM